MFCTHYIFKWPKGLVEKIANIKAEDVTIACNSEAF